MIWSGQTRLNQGDRLVWQWRTEHSICTERTLLQSSMFIGTCTAMPNTTPNIQTLLLDHTVILSFAENGCPLSKKQ